MRKHRTLLALVATLGLALTAGLVFGGLGSPIFLNSATNKTFPQQIIARYLDTPDGGTVNVGSSAPTATGQVLRVSTIGTAPAATWQYLPDGGASFPSGQQGQALINGTTTTTATTTGTTYTAQTIPVQTGDHKVAAVVGATAGYLGAVCESTDSSVTIGQTGNYVTFAANFGAGASQVCSGATCAGKQPTLPVAKEGQVFMGGTGTATGTATTTTTTIAPQDPPWTNTPLATVAPPIITGTATGVGTATTAARADHVHRLGVTAAVGPRDEVLVSRALATATDTRYLNWMDPTSTSGTIPAYAGTATALATSPQGLPSDATVQIGSNTPTLGQVAFGAGTNTGTSTSTGTGISWAYLQEGHITNLVADLAGKQASLGASTQGAVLYNGSTATGTNTTSSQVWGAPPAGIGGSGTIGYIPKFTDATHIGNGLAQDDGTNFSVYGNLYSNNMSSTPSANYIPMANSSGHLAPGYVAAGTASAGYVPTVVAGVITWQAPAATNGRLIYVTYVTTAGNWGSLSLQSATTRVRILGRGAGGGGGGANVTSGTYPAAGGGGGQGTKFEWWCTISGSITNITVGLRGYGGTSSGGNGGTGNYTTVTCAGNTATAYGGIGGQGMVAASSLQVAAGGQSPAPGGPAPANLAWAGVGGGLGFPLVGYNQYPISGAGGGEGGGAASTASTGNAYSCNSPGSGAGGGGAAAMNPYNTAGGDGCDGSVIVEEYAW